MGQNQDKLEGGEQALSKGLEETRPSPDSGGAGSPTGDVMEGGSSCEEEAGNTRENSEEPDAPDLDGSPGQEPTTPSSKKHKNLWVSPFPAREVRQGGAAGKEGGGGGEGGRTVLLVPQETDKNQKRSERVEEKAATYKLYNQIKRDKKKTEEEHHTSFKVKMENQDEGITPHEEIQDKDLSAGVSYERYGLAVTSEDANSLEYTEEESVMMKISRCGANAGSEFLQSDQNDTIMADVAGEDIKLCARTVDRLSERKGTPTAQPQHPLKNNLQKESLSDMSDTIYCRPPRERAENDTKEEMLPCEVKPVSSDSSSANLKGTDNDDPRGSVRPYLQMDTTRTSADQKRDSSTASNPASPTEPSSILEKLLKRNKKETAPALSEIKEAGINDKDTTDAAAKGILESAEKELSSDKICKSDVNKPLLSREMKGLREKSPKENLPGKDQHIKGLGMKQADTVDSSDALCFQPGVTRNTTRETSLTDLQDLKADCQSSKKNINTTDASLKREMEIKPGMIPSKNLCSSNLQSAATHERVSCKVSSLIAEESASSSVSDAKSPPTNTEEQIADSCRLLTTKKTDASTLKPPLQIKTDSESKADLQFSGSACSDAQPVRRKKVKSSIEDNATPAVDNGSVQVVAGRDLSGESHQITASMKQDPHMACHTENIMPDQPNKKLVKESDDSVSERDKSQSTPKSRPVSELIKETIQLHEKLQHQDRPKPAEVKCDEQGQSVKVAQMKAAFDSVQKSPDKAIERKPSVRKEFGLPDVPQTLASTLI